MSLLAWKLLALFIDSAQHAYESDYRRGYLASWTLGEHLGGNANTIDAIALKYTPRNDEERALRELVDLGLVEEMAELPCRFRLVVK